MSEETLPTDDAIERVGRRLYGGDWIGELTKRERWLIERYIEGGVRRNRSSVIRPVTTSYIISGRNWADVPGDPALMAEADRACDRRDWMDAQFEAACDWLEEQGFDLDSDQIDQGRFERAFAAGFNAGGVVAQSARLANPDPNERLTLPEQVRLLAQVMPEDRARARIDKAFRFREIRYQPEYAVAYEDARIDWASGRVVLRRLPRQPFTPTLSAAEFFQHFMPSQRFLADTVPTANEDDELQALSLAQSDAVATPVRPPGIRTNRNEDAERECEVFIAEWAAAFNAGKEERPRNKAAAFEAARKRCGEALSQKAFERVWRRTAPAAWKTPGAPDLKRRQSNPSQD
jgi:hypothetical protein